jgi:conjugative relaxase-like TrwC/TraI family protein
MLRISPSKAGAEAVKKYFIHASSQEAYYCEGQDFNGIWGGKGAARLGLSGSLQEGAFSRLCDNLHPLTGEKLTARMKDNRRVGYDVNFHVPKSVSLAYFYSGDERILQAIRQDAHETMLDVQENAAARVRKNGRDEDRPTRELTWAEFVHKTARPVDGFPDPLIHVHCYVFNATYDAPEDAWKALQFGLVMEEADSYEKAFHARLATSLKKLGLQIENNGYAFEVAGVSRRLIEKFSRRTHVIDAEAARRGITDAAEKAKLGALTREKKIQDVPMSELEPIWWARLSPEEKQALESIKAVLHRSRGKEVIQGQEELGSSDALGTRKELRAGREVFERVGGRRVVRDASGRPVSMNRATWPVEKPRAAAKPTDEDRKAVAFAIEHLFERQSVVTERQLIGEAFKNWNYGQATLEGVTEALRKWPFIRVERNGQNLITTQEVLAEEGRIVKKGQDGRKQYSALHPGWQIQEGTLNPQQKEAVLHVLGSRDFITGISGKAGTGKTTLLHEAKRGIEAGGEQLRVFAPTAEAARDTLRKQGFTDAETVALLLSSESLQEKSRGALWWVDEAGLMSCRSMDRLLELADKLNSRVVLVGDTGQHHAVERGQAFDLLQKFGGMAVAEVDEIQRQKGVYKTAVELISERKFEAGFQVLEKMGVIREFEIEADRQRAIAHDYVAAREAKKSALVVSPTHDEGRSVTQAIRHELKEKDALGEGKKWQVLRNLSWTAAQKRDARHYERGLVVQVNCPVKGFAVGERLEVLKAGKDKVLARGFGGQAKELPLSCPEDFNVFQRDAIEVCSGDRIRITANGRSTDRHPLHNGSFYTVREFSADGQIILDNGWHLRKDCAHLDYGYVTTSHVAQSKTVDWIFVAQSAALSSAATDANQFYVSVSRGREGVKIYTDSLELLRENVARVRERKMAMEILQEEKAAGEARSANAAEILESRSAVVYAKDLERLAASVERAKELQRVEPAQAEDRAAERLGTQKEQKREMAKELAKQAEAKARRQKRAAQMVMGM